MQTKTTMPSQLLYSIFVLTFLFSCSTIAFSKDNQQPSLDEANKKANHSIFNYPMETSIPIIHAYEELALESKERRHLMVAYYYKAIVYYENALYIKSLKFYNKMLQICIENDHKREEGVAYKGIGTIYYRQDKISKALLTWEKARKIFTSLKSNNDIIDLHIWISSGYRIIGKFEKALNYNFLSIDLLAPHDYIARGNVYNAIGGIYEKMDSFDLAEKYLNESISNFKRDFNIENKQYKNSGLALALKIKGILYNSKGNYKRARLFLEEALAYRKQTITNERGSAYILASIAESYIKEKNYTKAIKILHKILDNPSISEDKQLHSLCYDKLIKIHIDQTQFAKAIEYIQKSWPLSTTDYHTLDSYSNPTISQIDDLEEAIILLSSKGELFYSKYKHAGLTKDLSHSIETYELFALIIEKYRETLFFEHENKPYAKEIASQYEIAIKANLELYNLTSDEKYFENALSYSEKTKAMSLYSSIAEAKNNIGDSNLQDSLKAYNTTKSKIRILKIELQSRYHEKDHKKRFLLERLEMRQQLLKKLIKEKLPNYFYTVEASEGVNIKQIREVLGEKLLIEYFYGDSSIYVFVLNKCTSIVFSFKNDNTFKTNLKRLQNLVSTPNFSDKNLNQFIESSCYLYSKLLQPIEYLSQNSDLIIIPDGSLYNIPFEILIKKKNTEIKSYKRLDYLIRHHTITYSYSGRLFQELSKRPQTKTKNIIGFAPEIDQKLLGDSYNNSPSLSSIDTKIIQAALGTRPLQGAKETVNYLEKNFNATVFVNGKATEQAFKQNAPNYDIIHIGSHAFLINDPPLKSSLSFSINTDTSENGFLELWELYDLRLNASLAVLSGCETGLGGFEKGEGIISLTRGFFMAGCQSVLSSLWSVDDESNAKIMKDFYHKIGNGTEMAVALQEAKINYLDHPNNDSFKAHPFYWSTLVLNGYSAPSQSNNYNLILLFILLGAGLIYWKYKNTSH